MQRAKLQSLRCAPGRAGFLPSILSGLIAASSHLSLVKPFFGYFKDSNTGPCLWLWRSCLSVQVLLLTMVFSFAQNKNACPQNTSAASGAGDAELLHLRL
eukprot:1406434-Rhodomonas_salina.2